MRNIGYLRMQEQIALDFCLEAVETHASRLYDALKLNQDRDIDVDEPTNEPKQKHIKSRKSKKSKKSKKKKNK